MLEQKCALAFTVYACCETDGRDALCKVHYFEANPFTEFQVAGHYVWLDAAYLFCYALLALQAAIQS